MRLTNRMLPAMVLAALLPLVATPAEKPNPQQEGAALLARAAELSNIRSADSNPFQLRARIHARDLEGKPVEGSYLLIWAGPNMWREEITLGGFNQLRIGGKNEYAQHRSVRSLPLRVYQLINLLDVRARLRLGEEEKVKKVFERKENKVRMTCVQIIPKKANERELCLDPATNLLVREEQWRTTLRFEYGNYVTLEKHAFPRSLRLVDRAELTLEVDVEELSGSVTPDHSMFSAPQGAQIWKSCENPEPARLIAWAPGTLFLRQRPLPPVVVYAVIGPDGKLHNMTLLQSSDVNVDRAVMQMYEGDRYQPRMCNGVAVAEEKVFEFR